MSDETCYRCGEKIGFSYYALEWGYLCHECGKEIINYLKVNMK